MRQTTPVQVGEVHTSQIEDQGVAKASDGSLSYDKVMSRVLQFIWTIDYRRVYRLAVCCSIDLVGNKRVYGVRIRVEFKV